MASNIFDATPIRVYPTSGSGVLIARMSKTCKTVRLLETVLSESLTSGNIDREAGVIRGVKVLGYISKNGREYSDKAMDDGVKLYEGLRVNVDHPDRKNPKAERQFIEGFGELRNVRKEPSGVFADMHFKKSHPSAELVCESAERFPKQFGLSHNAEGEVVKRGGKPIVESLVRAESVDIVGKPATNEGLFESIDSSKGKPMKTIRTSIRSLVESAKSLTRYKLANLLEMEGGDSAMMGAPMDMEVPDGPDDETNPDDAIDDAFQQMVVATLADTTLDLAGKIARITEILTAQDSLMNGPNATKSAPTPPSGDAAVAESEVIKQLQTGLTKLLEAQERTEKRLAEADMRSTLIESKREATPERIAMLLKADEPTRKQLLESWPTVKPAVSKPSQSRPLMESVAAGEFPKDNKSFLREAGVKVAG